MLPCWLLTLLNHRDRGHLGQHQVLGHALQSIWYLRAEVRWCNYSIACKGNAFGYITLLSHKLHDTGLQVSCHAPQHKIQPNWRHKYT
jgi:hypothetical protein